MTERKLISNSPYEPKVGFSRAVVVGNTIYVSGTVGRKDDGSDGDPDIYEQTKQTIRNIETALAQGGSSLKDVVRTRVFVTDISLLDDVARAHGEAFGAIRPASSMIEISKLADPWMKVEIEAVAVL